MENTTRRRLLGSSEAPSTNKYVTMAKEHTWRL